MFEALSLNAEVVRQHEESLRERARALPDDVRKAYFAEYKRSMKDPDTYAVLNWFFLAGLHHMYLGRYARGAVNLIVLLVGIALFFSPLTPLGVVCIVVILAAELKALFRAETVVAHHNNMIAEALLPD